MADTVLPGDLNVGDVISLPDTAGELVVELIRLGHGGFVLTVSARNGAAPGAERVITLSAWTRVSLRGRVGAR